MEGWPEMGETHSDQPMFCSPTPAGPLETDVTEGCCWWGRGAIQTTGPSNYGAFQHHIIEKREDSNIDLCTNPQDMCNYEDLKFSSGFFYWANAVQTDLCFKASLKAYVESGFNVHVKPEMQVPISTVTWQWDAEGS